MKLSDLIFSTDGKIGRKEYFIFSIIATICTIITIFLMTFLGGIIYLSAFDKMLGNIHYLFFPAVVLFFGLIMGISIIFWGYITFSIRRARDFSKFPIKYVINFTLFFLIITILLIKLHALISIWKILILLYIGIFLPYLIFKSKKV